MEIVVTGTGYVGLITGTCLAEVGHSVTCVDIDDNKIEFLKSGKSPIYEPGLEEMLIKNLSSGRLNFTTDFKEAYKRAKVIFIGVGTPEKEDGSANLDYVFKVCKEIAENIENNSLVVVKSTVPIGTNDKIQDFFNENLVHKVKIEVASNPEFLAQGTAVIDTMEASRIVIGVESKESEALLREVYERFNKPIVSTNRKSAEMIKYASNDFLALKISFINEMANVCEIVGADIESVTKGMSYDNRIGDKFLKAGLGYGGSCFPKDTKALHWLANDHGYEIKTIKAAIEVNENQKFKMFRKAKQRFGNLKGKKVAVLGLTFKPDTDDLREAPSIPNIKRLLEEDAKIVVFDPAGMEKFKEKNNGNITYVYRPEEAIKDADMVFIFTEWKEIKSMQIEKYVELMNNAVIFDGRNCYSIEEVQKAKVDYYSVGREEILNINS